jgi:hypothetical protein
LSDMVSFGSSARVMLEPPDTANGDPGPQFPATVCCHLEVRFGVVKRHPDWLAGTAEVPQIPDFFAAVPKRVSLMPIAGIAAPFRADA